MRDTILPIKVLRDNNLNPLAKLVYSEIFTDAQSKGYSIVNKKILSKLYKVEEATINRVIKQLFDEGYIVDADAKIKKDVSSMYCNHHPLGREQCEWCEGYVLNLEEHHYPIPRSNGGKDTVMICSNCHSAYHFSLVVTIN